MAQSERSKQVQRYLMSKIITAVLLFDSQDTSAYKLWGV